MTSAHKAITIKEFEIAPGVKNTDWLELDLKPASPEKDWISATEMFRKRMERFLEPVRVLMDSRDAKTVIYSGFAIVALDCLLIETLQSFKTGRSNPVRYNDRLSTQMIIDFLTQRPFFKPYFDEKKARIFCDHFRNGMLHQGEVKSSGLIRIDTPEIVVPSDDNQSLVINRWKFHNALIKEVENYIAELIKGADTISQKNFIKKMNDISRIQP